MATSTFIVLDLSQPCSSLDAVVPDSGINVIPTSDIISEREASCFGGSEQDIPLVIPSAVGIVENGIVECTVDGADTESMKVENLDVKEDYQEHQPAKRAKRNGGRSYSGSDGMEVLFGNTAEIVLVLAGMAQMRAGRPPTKMERDLASKAYRKLGILVGKVAPNMLVSKESLEKMIHELHSKRVAQQKEDEARAEAAEAAAAAAAALRAAEAAAKAKAEAEEQEREQALSAAAATLVATHSNNKTSLPVGPSSSTSSGQSAQGGTSTIDSSSNPSQVLHPSWIESSEQVDGQNIMDRPKVSVSSQADNVQPPKNPKGRPPKAKKDVSSGALFTPNSMIVTQFQTESQRIQSTHKKLVVAVQQYIHQQKPLASHPLSQLLTGAYISNPIPCQICNSVVKDTRSVLVCDFCEQAFHIHCIPDYYNKGPIPKGEWSCPKCSVVGGSSVHIPKYGLLTCGISNGLGAAALQIGFGNNSHFCGVVGNAVNAIAAAAAPGVGGIEVAQEDFCLKVVLNSDDRSLTEMTRDECISEVGEVNVVKKLVNQPAQALSLRHPGGVDMAKKLDLWCVSGSLHHQADQAEVVNGIAIKSLADSQAVMESESLSKLKSLQEYGSGCGVVGRSEDGKDLRTVIVESGVDSANLKEIVFEPQKDNAGSMTMTGVSDKEMEATAETEDSDIGILVEWVGNRLEVSEGKAFYSACQVAGTTYCLSDCALFRPETSDVPPYIARLQVLWEDVHTGAKWVRVSWCYYPNDLPLAMGRPAQPEVDEVYESNHCDTNLVGSIQGPCHVLSPQKFHDEKEKRKKLKDSDRKLEGLPPIFLSRWLYDAPVGLFRPVVEVHTLQ